MSDLMLGDKIVTISKDEEIRKGIVTRDYSWKWKKISWDNGTTEYVRTISIVKEV